MCCGARALAALVLGVIVVDLGIVLLAGVIIALLVGLLLAAWEERRAG